jgi:hypothetical protein
MKKEFVSYDQAVALKELGFDEPCIGWFMKINPLGKEFLPSIRFDNIFDEDMKLWTLALALSAFYVFISCIVFCITFLP